MLRDGCGAGPNLCSRRARLMRGRVCVGAAVPRPGHARRGRASLKGKCKRGRELLSAAAHAPAGAHAEGRTLARAHWEGVQALGLAGAA